MEQNLPTTYQAPAPAANTSIFSDMGAFEGAQRVCKMLASSNLVPSQFQGNIANTMIALELANRTNTSPFMVMQNLYVVHGRPGFSATYIISAINACGRFSPLRFDLDGEGDDRGCTAWVIEKATGDRLEGSRVTIKMAKAEGWFGKQGSKWQTMPDQMLRYRAAAFFGRLYAPDILMGMQTKEELYDTETGPRQIRQAEPAQVVEAVVVESNNSGPASVEEINAMLQSAPEPAPAQPAAAEPVAEATTEPATGQPLTECQQSEAAPAEAEREAAQEQAKEDDQTAEYRRKMMEYVAEIDSLKAVSEVKWWANNKGYKRLQDELGGKGSQFYMAVMEHQQNRIAEMEGKK